MILPDKDEVVETPKVDKAKELHDAINEAIELNNVQVSKRPKLIIDAWCHSHVKRLHKESPNTEWLAWAKIVKVSDGVFKMVDMIHPGQTRSGTDVQISDDGLERAPKYLMENGENLELWNCVLHSHHSMDCFWSGTDDKARLDLNDGRELAWAVVTNYKGDVIGYKGCVNFYKPYNIEIDCDIEYEDVDYPTLCSTAQAEFNEALEMRYRLLLSENQYLLDDLKQEYSFDNIIDYLGIDIRKELEMNNLDIYNKLPQGAYREKLNEIYATAGEQVKEEFGEKYKDESDFYEWDNMLVKQLKDNTEQRYSYTKMAKDIDNEVADRNKNIMSENNRDFNEVPIVDNSKSEPKEGTAIDYEFWSQYIYDRFTEEDYPTKADLCMSCGLGASVDVVLFNGERWGYSNTYSEYIPLAEWFQELYETY